MRTVSLTLNGREVTATVEPRTHLGDFLREHRHLTGTHLGCEHGICGACTVLIDGQPARACITLAIACAGAVVTSIEGLDDDEIATELRAAFSREHALQCGYCTPGMLISARDVVARLDHPSEHEIRVAMSGNLCRCTGYAGIVRAIQGVIADRRARGIAASTDGRSRLGPVGSGHAKDVEDASSPTAVTTRPSLTTDAAPAADMPADFVPQATFERSFVIAQPRDVVWAAFSDLQAIVDCLPGAALTEATTDRRATGRMRVRAGPISADFHGAAEVTRNPETFSGTIVGSGRDRGSNSATRGRIGYRLSPGEAPDTTRVDLTVGYAVSGMLAQFSRSGLVQDIADRLIQSFVRNLEARLAGGASSQPGGAAELRAGSLIYSVLIARAKGWIGRILRR